LKITKEFIRDVPDFPKAGILFKDITTLLADAEVMEITSRI
jgi:adenine phosphoribosyltransferase